MRRHRPATGPRPFSGSAQVPLPAWAAMDPLIVAAAQYLPVLVVVAAAGIWLTLPRGAKFGLAVQAILSLALVAVLIQVAAAVHTDARPFVVNPSLAPLFAHPADNGFPSDHTALSATVALLVMRYRRALGAVLLAASVLSGAARVAAHVHHAQDIVGSLLIAVVTVALATAIWHWARPRLPGRLAEMAAVP